MDRKTLETAATDNTYLRGLLLVPLSLLFFLAALGNWSVGPFRHAWVFVVGVLVVGAAYQLVTHYYNERYGRATPSPQQQRKLLIATAASVVVMVAVSTLLRSRAAWSLDLPVNSIAVGLAVVFMISFATTVGVRRHHAMVLGALAVAGLLPVWRGGDPGNIGLVMAGVAVLVIGILDHLLLVRKIGPLVAEDTNAGA